MLILLFFFSIFFILQFIITVLLNFSLYNWLQYYIKLYEIFLHSTMLVYPFLHFTLSTPPILQMRLYWVETHCTIVFCHCLRSRGSQVIVKQATKDVAAFGKYIMFFIKIYKLCYYFAGRKFIHTASYFVSPVLYKFFGKP